MNIQPQTDGQSYEYTTFPRVFVTYAWFKPLLVALLTAVFTLMIQGITLLICLLWIGGPELMREAMSNSTSPYYYSGPGLLMRVGGVAGMLPALALAERIVRGRPFSSYSSSRGGWNWAAFFLSPYWFFYRKMYKPGIVFLTLRLCLMLLLFPYENKALELYQSLYANAANLSENAIQTALQEIFHTLIPVYIGGAVLVVLAVVSALLADRLYYGYVRRSIDSAKAQETRDTVLMQFLKRGGVSPLMAVLSYAAVSLIPNLILSFFN